MNGIHDMGGVQDMGPIPREKNVLDGKHLTPVHLH